ncbi:hypothetical protein H5410_047855 [Solanum commersonii]|uniref:DNA helicase Pif1-like 2B domain-containing protein n=1 Tax=Solanum commersonii TaxID=4109 RepID=A0A9J5XI63_SOLCO|nr:hypothetical protein H5410_047855 [Solanum commersonii]
MSEEYNKLYGKSHNHILQCTLISINYCLESMGKSIDIYDLPQLDHHLLKVGPSECREINEQMYVKISTEDFDAQSKLNSEQEKYFSKIVQTIDAKRARILFFYGPRGSGKHTYTVYFLPMLKLKENAPFMLLRNLDSSNGLCNDTRVICRGFAKNVVYAEISSGHCAMKHMFLPRIQLLLPENEG